MGFLSLFPFAEGVGEPRCGSRGFSSGHKQRQQYASGAPSATIGNLAVIRYKANQPDIRYKGDLAVARYKGDLAVARYRETPAVTRYEQVTTNIYQA